MFSYHCPECRTTNRLHREGCQFQDVHRADYEKAYVDILGVLSELVCSKATLEEQAHEWSSLHEAALDRLKTVGRVEMTDDGNLRLLRPDAVNHAREPTKEPLATIYRHGTVQGCHDNGIFALIAYFSSLGLSWEETKEQMLSWFDETGTWDRGGFSESSPEAVLEEKYHVWENEYGWGEKGKAAKRVIEQRQGSPSAGVA